MLFTYNFIIKITLVLFLDLVFFQPIFCDVNLFRNDGILFLQNLELFVKVCLTGAVGYLHLLLVVLF